jgi:hypothetical protein
MTYGKVFSVKTTPETEKLLKRMYQKVIADKLNGDVPRLMSRAQAFELIVKQAAEQRGVTVV